MSMEDISSSGSQEATDTWISAFCNLLGHEYFAEVTEDFIEDDFNLTGLSSQVPLYKEALEMVLDVEPEEEEDEEEEEEEDEDEDLPDEKQLSYRRAGDRRQLRAHSDASIIESSAELLYGLIHQRYITSRPGIQQMYEKYELGHFGACPRVLCGGCRVLPVGISDVPGRETVKLFCPSCLDVYTPPNSRFQTVDGAFFGTTFGCLFFMTFPEINVSTKHSESLTSSAHPAEKSTTGSAQDASTTINGVPISNMAPGLGAGNIYEPRIYGFRVAERAKTGPKMQWLRMKPDDVRELDECKRYHEDIYNSDLEHEQHDIADTASKTEDLSQRKKAPLRRRRRTNSRDENVPMDTNGVNGVG